MKYLKTFESWESPMSRDEMCDYLSQCGYEMNELDTMSDDELHMVCTQMKNNPVEESINMGKEEMIQHLRGCGYSMKELLSKEEEELYKMCIKTQEEDVMEKKEWISDAIKKPGALRKKLGKEEGEKISKEEIDDELTKLHKKDKDPDKPGDQLSKKDAQKKKQLTLAKTLKDMK